VTKAIENKFDVFLSDPHVRELIRISENSNIFEIFGANEDRHTNFLAWLAEPNDAHGLRDGFICELLRTVFRSKNQQPLEYMKDENELRELVQFSDGHFMDALVYRDLSVRGEKIDLAIAVPSQELLIVIENKIASSKNTEKLGTYFDIVEEEFSETYSNRLHVYLDYHMDESKEIKNWSTLNYGFVTELTKRNLTSDSLAPRAKQILADYYEYMEENYIYSPTNRRYFELVTSVAKKYPELLQAFRKVDKKEDLGVEVPGTDKWVAVNEVRESEYLKNIYSFEGFQAKMLGFYVRYSGLVENLLESTGFETIMRRITEKYGADQVEFSTNSKNFYLRPCEFKNFDSDPVNKKWSLQLCLNSSRTSDNERKYEISWGLAGHHLRPNLENSTEIKEFFNGKPLISKWLRSKAVDVTTQSEEQTIKILCSFLDDGFDLIKKVMQDPQLKAV